MTTIQIVTDEDDTYDENKILVRYKIHGKLFYKRMTKEQFENLKLVKSVEECKEVQEE